MPRMPRMPRPSRALAGVTVFLLAAFAAVPIAGCSRHPAVEEQADEDEDADSLTTLDASRKDAADAADAADARDARSDEELAQIADAGRFCGEKGLADCPLQVWMKRNATPILGFGETTTLAEVFDQIALFAPPAGLTRESFRNWASIARDGAAASRMGNVPAARAACRGCHAQYLASYHTDFRGLALQPSPPPPPGRRP
jgi:hypothetical protein